MDQQKCVIDLEAPVDIFEMARYWNVLRILEVVLERQCGTIVQQNFVSLQLVFYSWYSNFVYRTLV